MCLPNPLPRGALINPQYSIVSVNTGDIAAGHPVCNEFDKSEIAVQSRVPRPSGQRYGEFDDEDGFTPETL